MIKKRITILFSIFIFSLFFSQKDKTPTAKEILKEISVKTCKCIDSIGSYDKTKEAVNKEISLCIDKNVLVYSMTKTLAKTNADIESGKIKDKKINVTISSNPESEDYKNSYYEIESYLMDTCPSIKNLVNAAESKEERMTDNKAARDFYDKAIAATQKEDWKEAIKNYKSALEKDPKFIYAWDNLGICYRRAGEYDNAVNAYKKSLEIGPKGKMPLQNLAITYSYKKEYQKAIDSYLTFDAIYPGDAEVYYGIGQIYYEYLKDNEKSLDYMAKAYNIYTDQKSPYRSDAETIINYIYKKMKDDGKAEKFKEILKTNKIRFE